MWLKKLFGWKSDASDDEPARHPPVATASARKPPSKVAAKPKKTAQQGFDPYNSGTFERHNAWERVHRR